MRLRAENLACVRGGRTVFEGLSFSVAAGEGLLLTGPNGAGKSSLLRLIAGLLPAAGGDCELEGGSGDAPLGEQCHYVGHLNGIKRALSLKENLDFWAGYLGGGGVDAAMAQFALSSLAGIPAGLLSAGQARRLALARLALVHRPVWLLDEPAVSLDASSQKHLADAIRAHLRQGGIAIAATHTPLGVKFASKLKLGGGKSKRAKGRTA